MRHHCEWHSQYRPFTQNSTALTHLQEENTTKNAAHSFKSNWLFYQDKLRSAITVGNQKCFQFKFLTSTVPNRAANDSGSGRSPGGASHSRKSCVALTRQQQAFNFAGEFVAPFHSLSWQTKLKCVSATINLGGSQVFLNSPAAAARFRANPGTRSGRAAACDCSKTGGRLSTLR
jgi:hypothetical protein